MIQATTYQGTTLHRTCSAALELVERKNELWQGLFFLFLIGYKKTI